MMMSPDGSSVVDRELGGGGMSQVFLVEDVPKAPNGAAINATNPAQSEVPVRKVTGIGGEFATWAADGRHIYYALGHSLFTYDLTAADVALLRPPLALWGYNVSATAEALGVIARAAPATAAGGGSPTIEATRFDVAITVKKDRPSARSSARAS
jgi:hypothetical protein